MSDGRHPRTGPETGVPGLVITSIFTLHHRADQQQLFALLARNAVDVLERTPGFLGSTLSLSDDHATLVHQATWTDARAVQAMLDSPAARAGMIRTRQLADVTVIRSSTTHRYRPHPG